MPLIHTWQDIQDLGGDDWLTPAERKLIDACKAGEMCKLGDGTRPSDGPPDPNREIRANVLRYLILGGCENQPLHDLGVQVAGGYITGQLDLSFAYAKGPTGLLGCRFDAVILFRQTHFETLALDESSFPGLISQDMQVIGNVFLRKISSINTVNLLGAKVGGQLSCIGSKFLAKNGDALIAQGVQVNDDIRLNDISVEGLVSLSNAEIGGLLNCENAKFSAIDELTLNAQGMHVRKLALNAQGMHVGNSAILSNVIAKGEVSLSGSEIGGQLVCNGAKFSASNWGVSNAQDAPILGNALAADKLQVAGHVIFESASFFGQVSLLGAEIGGQFVCTKATFSGGNGTALCVQGVQVADGLIWQKVNILDGLITFTSAHIGDLVDDVESWPKKGGFHLNGFTYARISGTATAIDIQTRIDWLENGSVWDGEFFPQPFSHLTKVLRGIGHELDAQKVLVKRDQLLGKFSRRRSWKNAGNLKKVGLLVPLLLRIIFDWLYHYIAGYGHRPIFSLGWLIGLILTAGVFAHLAWDEGSFAPNSGPVLVSQDWKDFADLPDNPARLWSAKGAPGQDWETFYAGAWAADLVIPIVDLGQSDAWAPSTARGGWGRFLWWAQWLFVLAGWVVTALGAAALTGVIRRE